MRTARKGKRGCLLLASLLWMNGLAQAWWCPKCQTEHTQWVCSHPDADGPYWWCNACNTIHVPRQTWKNKKEKDFYSCENNNFPCTSCLTVHEANQEFSADAWCCTRCHCTHTTNTTCPYGSWYCTSCRRQHAINDICPYSWYCSACQKHHLQTDVCPNNNWFCSFCQKAYKSGEYCEHSWYCEDCHSMLPVTSICTKHKKWYCAFCGTIYKQGNVCLHYWWCEACNTRHAIIDKCEEGNWFCEKCFEGKAGKTVYKQTEICAHFWFCSECQTRYSLDTPCKHSWFCDGCKKIHTLGTVCSYYWSCELCEKRISLDEVCEHYWYCPEHKARHNMDAMCEKGYVGCKECQKRLGIGEACKHFWTCHKHLHHAVSSQTSCEAGYWICPLCWEENRYKTYEKTENCSHAWWCETHQEHHSTEQHNCDKEWYCTGCHIGHLLDGSCPNGYWFCSTCTKNEQPGVCYKASETPCCQHLWYCPSSCQRGHGYQGVCTNKYYFCPTCKTPYDSQKDPICKKDFEWFCKSHGYGHAKEETCDQSWLCLGCYQTYAAADITCGKCHSWYCETHHIGHLLTEVCDTFWFCPECQASKEIETSRYKKTEVSLCTHRWLCPTCGVGHLKTAPCPQKTYWYCELCEQEKQEKCIYAAEDKCPHSWMCKCQKSNSPKLICSTCHQWCYHSNKCSDKETVFDSTKQTICPKCYSWCCIQCNTAQLTNETCSCSWFCSLCLSREGEHKSFHPINTNCPYEGNRILFGCGICKQVLIYSCEHLWMCPDAQKLLSQDETYCQHCNEYWHCTYPGCGNVVKISYGCNQSSLHQWFCPDCHCVYRFSENPTCPNCEYWCCKSCTTVQKSERCHKGHRRPKRAINLEMIFVEDNDIENPLLESVSHPLHPNKSARKKAVKKGQAFGNKNLFAKNKDKKILSSQANPFPHSIYQKQLPKNIPSSFLLEKNSSFRSSEKEEKDSSFQKSQNQNLFPNPFPQRPILHQILKKEISMKNKKSHRFLDPRNSMASSSKNNSSFSSRKENSFFSHKEDVKKSIIQNKEKQNLNAFPRVFSTEPDINQNFPKDFSTIKIKASETLLNQGNAVVSSEIKNSQNSNLSSSKNTPYFKKFPYPSQKSSKSPSSHRDSSQDSIDSHKKSHPSHKPENLFFPKKASIEIAKRSVHPQTSSQKNKNIYLITPSFSQKSLDKKSQKNENIAPSSKETATTKKSLHINESTPYTNEPTSLLNSLLLNKSEKKPSETNDLDTKEENSKKLETSRSIHLSSLPAAQSADHHAEKQNPSIHLSSLSNPSFLKESQKSQKLFTNRGEGTPPLDNSLSPERKNPKPDNKNKFLPLSASSKKKENLSTSKGPSSPVRSPKKIKLQPKEAKSNPSLLRLEENDPSSEEKEESVQEDSSHSHISQSSYKSDSIKESEEEESEENEEEEEEEEEESEENEEEGSKQISFLTSSEKNKISSFLKQEEPADDSFNNQEEEDKNSLSRSESKEDVKESKKEEMEEFSSEKSNSLAASEYIHPSFSEKKDLESKENVKKESQKESSERKIDPSLSQNLSLPDPFSENKSVLKASFHNQKILDKSQLSHLEKTESIVYNEEKEKFLPENTKSLTFSKKTKTSHSSNENKPFRKSKPIYISSFHKQENLDNNHLSVFKKEEKMVMISNEKANEEENVNHLVLSINPKLSYPLNEELVDQNKPIYISSLHKNSEENKNQLSVLKSKENVKEESQKESSEKEIDPSLPQNLSLPDLLSENKSVLKASFHNQEFLDKNQLSRSESKEDVKESKKEEKEEFSSEKSNSLATSEYIHPSLLEKKDPENKEDVEEESQKESLNHENPLIISEYFQVSNSPKFLEKKESKKKDKCY